MLQNARLPRYFGNFARYRAPDAKNAPSCIKTGCYARLNAV